MIETLSPQQKIRIVYDQVLYTGTARELVYMFFCDQWFTNDATPELWMQSVSDRLGGRVRTDDAEMFVYDMIWEVNVWEILKREISVNAAGEPELVWPR